MSNMAKITIYAESPGDPSVGIPREFAEIHMDIVDSEEREAVRDLLSEAFSEIWDNGGTWVYFEDECKV